MYQVSIPPKRLQLGILSTDMAFTLNNILRFDGVALSNADFGGLGFGTFRNAAGTKVEFFIFDPTTIASAQITILYRGLDYKGGTVDGAETKYDWNANETIVVIGSNQPALWSQFVDLGSTQTITGFKTFTQTPAGINPGGQPDAALGTKGVVSLSTSPNKTLGTATITIASPGVVTLNSHGLILNDAVQFTTTGFLPTGLSPSTNYYVISTGLTSNNFELAASIGGTAINTSGTQSGVHTLIKVSPTVVSNVDSQYVNYFTDTGTANTYVLTPSPAISVYSIGQRFSFKAAAANTTTSTLNVNALGGKTIVRSDGSTVLIANDILLGQIVSVEYDGTNFVMLSGPGNLPVSPATLAASIKFGGTGTDGALVISSGTTTIDLANAQVVVKNYTSISITGTGKLAFSNPGTAGTEVILKSQGAVTLTSSTAPMIDMSGIGASGGAGGAVASAGSIGTSGFITSAGTTTPGNFATATNPGAISASAGSTLWQQTQLNSKFLRLFTGSGGGGGAGADSGAGSGAGGSGGRGGGALLIECAGALNFTTASGISVAGNVGVQGTDGATTTFQGAGGGGGGAGGSCIILYNTLTSSSGTITISGGTGGRGGNPLTGAGGTGGSGGSGSSGSGQGAAGGASTGTAGDGGGGGGADSGLTNGTTGNTGSASSGVAGGGGGGGCSGYSLVTQNVYFA